MKSLLFLGAKDIGYECLRYLIEQRRTLEIAIAAVLTNHRGQSIEQLALENGIPVLKELEDLRSGQMFDLLISIQYHRILTREHLDCIRTDSINLHMAPLPEYRGCNQFSFAIVNGESEFGTTLHLMDTRIDNGPILAQRRFSIPNDCFVEELYKITKRESLTLFQDSIPAIIRRELRPIPQAEWGAGRPSKLYFRKDIERLKEIDLEWPKEKIYRHLRATLMPGFPPPFCRISGRKIFFAATQER